MNSSPSTSPPSTHLLPGIALAAAGSIAFSGKAIIVKLAYRHGVDAVTLLMYRMLFALPLFAFMAWWAGRGKPRLTRRDAVTLLGLGFSGYYLASFLDFWGLRYISASLERLILYLNPTLVLVMGWLFWQRRIRVQQVLAMVISYAGVLVVFGHEASLSGPQAVWGMLLVLGSAVSYAYYLAASGQVVQRLGSLRLAGWATMVACSFCILQFLLLKPLEAARVPQEVIVLSLLNAVFCTALPVVMVMMAIERIGSALASQVGMIGPMSTLFMGVLILGEPMNMWIVAGTLLVMLGVYVVTRVPQH